MIAKLAEAGTIEAMTLILSACGFVSGAETQSPESVVAIEAFLGWVPTIITILMCIPVFFINIPKEMEESKQKAALEAK